MKIGNLDISSFKVGGADCSIYLGDTKLYPSEEPTPTLQWVAFNDGDTIPSDLDIYGISGVSRNLYNTFGYGEHFKFTPSRNRIETYISCNGQTCYSDSPYNTDTISLILSDIGCCDYVNQGATVSGTIQLYIMEEPTPPTPTDNWVLVDESGFANLRKVKVDYSLIEDDDSEVRDDYNLDSHDSGPHAIMYLNQPTLEWMMQEGYGGDELAEYYQKVGLFSSSDGIIGILEDGVEYASIGGINLSDFYISLPSSTSNYYLYATQ